MERSKRNVRKRLWLSPIHESLELSNHVDRVHFLLRFIPCLSHCAWDGCRPGSLHFVKPSKLLGVACRGQMFFRVVRRNGGAEYLYFIITQLTIKKPQKHCNAVSSLLGSIGRAYAPRPKWDADPELKKLSQTR